MIRRRKSKLPKWRYEFDCRKCDNIREILDPLHREHYESIEPVNEACRLARVALYKQMKGKPYPDGDRGIVACPNCKSGEYLYNEDGNRNEYCGQCGKRIDWE